MSIIDAIAANTPLPDKPGSGPARTATAPRRASGGDGVVISEEALAAAESARFSVVAAGNRDIREELIAEARADLERGAHRIQEVVMQVAQRMFPLVEP
ncbi:MAG TPA: hypothetical protein PKI11_14580 [Candidatus Hydrogenedentes bacterium]|nr:hypothetical protein [Candidatus Hydrogenedentota bacterium]